LIAEGIISPSDEVSFATRTQGQNDTTGLFTISFDVTAVEGDFTIVDIASTSATTSTGGVRFTVDTTSSYPDSISAVLSSTADEVNPGVFTVREGRSETFTLTVVVDASASGQHRVALNEVFFSENSDGVTGAQSYRVLPAQDFRTQYLNIVN
jgi:hypothetical protein